jgi:hypothetical protein
MVYAFVEMFEMEIVQQMGMSGTRLDACGYMLCAVCCVLCAVCCVLCALYKAEQSVMYCSESPFGSIRLLCHPGVLVDTLDEWFEM